MKLLRFLLPMVTLFVVTSNQNLQAMSQEEKLRLSIGNLGAWLERAYGPFHDGLSSNSTTEDKFMKDQVEKINKELDEYKKSKNPEALYNFFNFELPVPPYYGHLGSTVPAIQKNLDSVLASIRVCIEKLIDAVLSSDTNKRILKLRLPSLTIDNLNKIIADILEALATESRDYSSGATSSPLSDSSQTISPSPRNDGATPVYFGGDDDVAHDQSETAADKAPTGESQINPFEGVIATAGATTSAAVPTTKGKNWREKFQAWIKSKSKP